MPISSDDLKAIRDLAGRFADKELGGNGLAADGFNDIVEKAFGAGFLNMMLPSEPNTGGIGALCVVLKEICRKDASLGGIIFTAALVQELLVRAGVEEVFKDVYARPPSAQEALVAFPCYADPSQTEALPEAELSDGTYRITGKLDLLVLGGVATRAIVPARIRGGSGYSFFLVDPADRALTRSAPVMTLGLQDCPAVDVTMDGLNARLIGEPGGGAANFERISGKLHAAAGAMNMGIMRGCVEEAVPYARQRFQGGRAIIDWSEIRMILAGMVVKTEAAELCLEQAWRILESGEDAAGRRSIAAALHIHELACGVVNDGVQVLGGYGYMKDYGQEKRYRDARQVQTLLGAVPFKKLALMEA